MSAAVLQRAGLLRSAAESRVHKQPTCEPQAWDPEKFAREQIRGLVRTLFFSSDTRPVRQVIFSSTDSEIDVSSICKQVGVSLAFQTPASVVVICKRLPSELEGRDLAADKRPAESPTRGPVVHQVRKNLWLVNETGPVNADEPSAGRALDSRLWELRRDFQYSIVEGPVASEFSGVAALGQAADGVVLVLAAQHTRRAMARKIKEDLEAAHARILGVVLSERTFPIPAGIYRRL